MSIEDTKMTILQFPGNGKKTTTREFSRSSQVKQALPKRTEPSALFMQVIWVLIVLLWPILRKLLALDCVIQFLIAMYHWDTAPIRGCLTFGAHFAALTALTYFVTFYKPKGL